MELESPPVNNLLPSKMEARRLHRTHYRIPARSSRRSVFTPVFFHQPNQETVLILRPFVPAHIIKLKHVQSQWLQKSDSNELTLSLSSSPFFPEVSDASEAANFELKKSPFFCTNFFLIFVVLISPGRRFQRSVTLSGTYFDRICQRNSKLSKSSLYYFRNHAGSNLARSRPRLPESNKK